MLGMMPRQVPELPPSESHSPAKDTPWEQADIESPAPETIEANVGDVALAQPPAATNLANNLNDR
jgi:hypothetical protein